MTREMNKPEWHNEWKRRTDRLHPCGYKFCQYYFNPKEDEHCKKCLIKPKEPELDEWIKPFIEKLNEVLKEQKK